MLNQVVLVGRLVRDPTMKKTESGRKMSYITLAIPRSFKNVHGEYDSDFIDCIQNNKPFIANLKDGLEAELIAEAVHKSADTHEIVKIERR